MYRRRYTYGRRPAYRARYVRRPRRAIGVRRYRRRY